MSPPRTRFAPSPTGFLHVGSARTALFNWAFARRHAGAFVLRIEDTDRERSTRESEQAIVDGLRWLGLDWDEGPFRQTERADRYRAAIEELIGRGRAYRCVCTREELEARRAEARAGSGKIVYDGRCRDRGLGPDCGPHTVRLRLPDRGRIGWDDAVFGPSGQDAAEIGDSIVQRSDGTPLYTLTNVVDDADMGITHVIRGADIMGNTPLQLVLYQALGRTPPVFAHVPLIVGPGGKKLSKRRDPVSVQQFREEGYLPEAMLNWLVRLGWSHGDDEIFSREDVARLFDLDAVGRGAAQADPQKLQWLNQHWIKTLPLERLWPALAPHLERVAGHPVERSPGLDRLLELLRERSRTLAEMAERAAWLVREPSGYEPRASRKHLAPDALPLLRALGEGLAKLADWTEPEIERVFETVRAEHGSPGMGRLAQPVRVAVTGSAASPGIYETLAVLGQQRSVERIARAARWIERERPAERGSA